MNQKQFSECMGDIDEKLVYQAEQIPNFGRRNRRKRIGRILSAAAAIALMVCSFRVGTLVSAHNNKVEVLVEHETLTLDEISLTMILPDSWRGTYSVKKEGQNYIVYNKQIHEAFGSASDDFDGGILFTIVCYNEAMTPEQFEKKGYDFTGYRYLFSTSDNTYILCYASDVQWDTSDVWQEELYHRMTFEIKEIQFVAKDVLLD